MDSDNSDGDVEHHGMVNPPKKHVVDDTSDVSDDENISHAARSIESPPESPQEAGHFESPPASPASDKLGGTPSSPRSPDEPRSQSPDDRRSLDESISSKDPRSPDDIGSPGSAQMSRSMFAPRTPQYPGPRSPDDCTSPTGPQSPDDDCPRSPAMRGPRSPDSRRPRSPDDDPASPYDGPQSPAAPRSPEDGMCSPDMNRRMPRSPVDVSPRSIHSPRTPRSPDEYLRPARSRSISPPPSPQSLPPEDRGVSSPLISEKGGHLSDSNSDDGRSNISSNSSFGSPSPRTLDNKCSEKLDPLPVRPAPLEDLQNHAEDLSDVSELGSLDCVSDDEGDKKVDVKMENGEQSPSPTRIKEELVEETVNKEQHSSRVVPSGTSLEGDDGEALDFEPGEEREEGECEALAGAAKVSDDEGELKGEELEEGELTDEGENRPEETEPRPICRFYNRGQCTWGSQCRFVHPGVTDKGNYTMFEMVRPLVPVNGPQAAYSAVDYRPVERPVAATATIAATTYPHTTARKEEVPVIESAWERGLRQAKEMLRKSSKRKETEVDFEEKKMNLTLSQDELDKENDLYLTRTGSPNLSEEPDRWSAKVDEGKRFRTVSERFEEYGGGPEYMYHATPGRDWYHRGSHYDASQSHHALRESDYHQSSRSKYHGSYSAHHRSAAAQPDYYERKKHKQYPPREVIVQRVEKSAWKDDSPPPSRSSRRGDAGRDRDSGGRADDWADPWMRSKSPVGRKGRSRKQSYSSGSTYSSSSSSPSSRSSSYSSGSRGDSRSRSHSTRSRSRSRKPVSPSRRLIRSSPFNRTAGRGASPAVLSDKWANPERALMNPPPPSPRKGRGPSSPATMRRNPTPPERRGGVPARLLAHSKAAVAAAMRSARSRSKSSHSSSGSDSSGSSSDSSESSVSSSSSSRGPSPSPPIRSKRIVIDERLALAQAAMKVKAMDALKLSGQKQQIKLTLKGSANSERPQPTVVVGKKRPLESPTLPDDGSPPKGISKSAPKKTAPSRREELLKQLKAVEDAIARKRSKIM